MTTTRKTKATRGKLERALDELDSFWYADDVDTVLSKTDKAAFAKALDTIQGIESRLYHTVV